MLKKIILSVFSLVFVFGFYNSVSAFESITPTVICTTGDSFAIYSTSSQYRRFYAGCGNSLSSLGFTETGNFNFYEYNSNALDLNDQLADPFNFDTITDFENSGLVLLTANYDLLPPTPTPTVTTAGIFFPRDEITGETTAGVLTASVGGATVDTVSSFTPIVTILLGIILAFLFIRFLISTIYDTKQSKKDNKGVKRV